MLKIKKSGISGKGVFTTNKIKKNKKIFKFADGVIKLNHKSGCHCKVCCRCINLKGNLWLYPAKDSYGWNLNHSCNPNSYSKGKFIFALKKINLDTEITIDYSTTNIDKNWKMKCHCNSIHCRKTIKSIQYLSKKQFKKYKNHMQQFIKNSYG